MGVFEQSDETATIGSPFVLLRDNRGRCVIIWIGRFEAFAISTGLENLAAERPLTHDLLRNVTERLGATVERIVVDDLWGETFYAKVWLTHNGSAISIDARPSDAIALAVRSRCPVYVVEAVLEEAGRPCEDFEPPES
ncbi:MAG: bifunctional nuclease family protein [Armatimonadetes bacterium]|nr:bifunctional nuclease family protein [Armatimonadota bacterium]